MSGVDHCFLSFAATGSFILHAESLHLMEPEILRIFVIAQNGS